jgi:U3 small nucleolar RNA-associated protein 3
LADDSDHQEGTSLDPLEAAEKARRKKTLRFYTSQIAQKANKRNNAGKDVGGDADIPYRERLKDRQARLNAQAERRRDRSPRDKLTTLSDAHSDQESHGSREADRADNDSEDDYYDMVAAAAKKRKIAKKSLNSTSGTGEASRKGGLHGEEEEGLGPDNKRAIGYMIEKNKGLAPKRKKEVRNPRVKKRKKFAEKQKKLGSIRQVYRGGEERGGYSGEATGIKTRLVKSIKL